MKKNRVIAGAMGVMMLGAMVMPVSAAGTGDTEALTGNVNVKYEEPSTFTLTIPADLTLSQDTGAQREIGLSAINVSTTEKVQIKITNGISEGKVTLTDVDDSKNTCASTVSLSENGEGIANDAVIAEFKGTSTTAALGGTLHFSALGDVPAGTYSGQITFQASIVSTKTE